MTIDIACFDELDAVAADAGDALGREACPSLFDRIEWFRLVADHCPLPGRPLIIRARDGKDARWLFLVGDGPNAYSLTCWYSFDFGLVGRGCAALDEAIARALRTHFSGVELRPVADPGPIMRAFRAAGWLADIREESANWCVAVDGWESYWRARPARLRNTVARRARFVSTRITTHFDPDDWAAYERVYQASWKPAEGAPALLREMAMREPVRIGLATVDGRVAAAQIWLVENDVASVHKLAHDAAEDRHSPGTVLTAAMFRHVMEQDQVKRIDFGTGDDAYKADWMDERRPLYHLRFRNPRSARGLAGAARDRVSALARRLRAG